MIVCSKCGYENLDDVLYCNLCKEIFRKEKIPLPDKITSFSDLPDDIKNLLQRQKAEIMNKGNESLGIYLKKGYWLFTIIGLGIVALILLRFFLSHGKI